MRKIQSTSIAAILIAALVAFGLGWIFAKNTSGPPSIVLEGAAGGENIGPLRIRDIDEVWGRLQESYYDATKLELGKLEYGAVKGFVEGIEDPYTVFMTPDESKEFADGIEGQIQGIGAELEVKNGKLVVVALLKSSPAQRAGLRSKDIIYKIDGELAEEMTFYQAIQSIRGKKGTTVALTIVRENLTEPMEIKIIRDEITVDSVVLEKLEGDIFHLALHQFNDHSKKEIENAVQQILLEKARGIILDVRSNGGGFMERSIDILSEFIAAEKVVVIVRHRNETDNELVKTNGNARLADIPLVVLVNEGSASASEIVAGAIQDYGRGVVIGEKTFGKGSVQEISDLRDGARLRMTIAKWFTPLERSIDEVGIAPDIEIKITEEDIAAGRDPQLEAAVRYLKNL